MSRCSQRSPNVSAWRLSLLGTATAITPPGESRRDACGDRVAGVGEMLERVPEDDGGPLASISDSGSSRKSSRAELRSSPTASRPRARSASIRVPSPAPTSRIGPAGAIASMRRARAARVRLRIASPAKLNRCPSLGAVPGAVGGGELRVGRPRAGRGRTAGLAPDAAGEVLGLRSEGLSAPDTLVPGALDRHAQPAGARHTAQTSSASSRPVSRSSKSPGSIAAARSSGTSR